MTCMMYSDMAKHGEPATQRRSDPKPDPADMHRAMEALKVCTPAMRALKRLA